MAVLQALAGQDPIAVRSEILAAHHEFWDDRDLTAQHHPVWLRQFGAYGQLARDGDRIVGYLLGTVTADGVGYVHLVALRRGHRRQGLGRALWGAFEQRARQAGARVLQAVTTPDNVASIAFHRSLGMSTEYVADYSGEGHPRVLFNRVLGD